MSFLIVLGVLGITPLALYLIAKLHPPAAELMQKYPGIVVAAFIVGGFVLSFAFHEIVVAPCRATTKSHTVTDNLGRFYTTEYKDSGEWCLWVRSEF